MVGTEAAHSFYLSSPLLGLERERALVQRLIGEQQQACRHSYSHANEPPVPRCQADVRRSDHYVLVLAGRYGTPMPEYRHKSLTELEFDEAVKSACTLHAFFLNFISDARHGVDDDAGRARLLEFQDKVQRHCTAQVCNSEAEFADAIKLLAAAPPSRPGDSAADPTLPERQTPHNLPFRSEAGDGLVGREQALERLEALLSDGQGPVLITGMDGVGKTALALHHLRRRLEHYRGGIVLLDGQADLTGLVAQLTVFLYSHFELMPPEELPPAARLAWLYSHWPGQAPALLLLDELERPQDLRALGQGLPQRLQLLVTCRRQLGEARRRVPLAPLQQPEAVALLEQLAERDPFTARERRDAAAIAREVGGLPLALQLLGRQLARDADLELADLAVRLRRRGALAPELQGAGMDLQVERGLQAGFAVVWAGLTEAERELASVVGALPAAPLPWDLLAPCRPEAMVPEAWEEARLGLAQQHLLERVGKGVFEAHPLLHDLFADQARSGAVADRADRLGAALAPWLAGWSEVLQAQGRDRCERCLPLLEALAAGPQDGAGLLPGLASLALGRVRTALGAYPQAEDALAAALPLLRDAGEASALPLQAGCLVALAGIARERGQLPQAEANCREALALLAAVGEGAWPLERAEALNGLGLVLHALGQAEMEPDAVLREALGLRLARLGNEHRLVQISRNNLGRWLVRQGQFAEAEQLYNAALAALADEPCEVAVALHNNRGALADRQGRQAEALAELEQAVKLAALVLGERHPRRAMMLYNLAVLSEREGVPTAALDHYSLALELVRDAWGEEHPQSKEIREVLEAVLAEIDRAEP